MACLPLAFAAVLAASLAQSGSPDARAREKAVQLGLAHVAQGADEKSAQDALDLFRDVELPKLERRHERLLQEIERLGEHDWAGTYYCGDGLGKNVSLTIAPDAGATYTWHGCLGLYDLNHGGIVEASEDSLTLDLAIDPALNNRWYQSAMPRRYMSAEWIVVRWGTERYLVPSSQMIPFCNDVSRGGWGGDFPRRRGRPMGRFECPPEGLPVVPEIYRPFLLSAPLSGSILTAEKPSSIGKFIGGKEKLLVRAEVDLGAEQGLLPGMEIFVTEPDGRGTGEVVLVGERRASVEFRFAAQDWKRDIPRQGWSVSTKPPDRRSR